MGTTAIAMQVTDETQDAVAEIICNYLSAVPCAYCKQALPEETWWSLKHHQPVHETCYHAHADEEIETQLITNPHDDIVLGYVQQISKLLDKSTDAALTRRIGLVLAKHWNHRSIRVRGAIAVTLLKERARGRMDTRMLPPRLQRASLCK